MRETDLEGKGRWTRQAVRERYGRSCRMYRIEPRDLPAGNLFSARGWIAERMSGAIDGIRQGDLACAEIGIELIGEDGGFAFGRIPTSNTARAPGRRPRHDARKDRIRARVVDIRCDWHGQCGWHGQCETEKGRGPVPVPTTRRANGSQTQRA